MNARHHGMPSSASLHNHALVRLVWLDQLSLRVKLLVNAIFPIVLFGAFVLWQGLALTSLGHQDLAESARAAQRALLAQALDKHVVQVQQFFSDVSATRAQDGLDDGFKLAAKERAAFEHTLQALAADGATPAFRQQAEAVAAAFARYYTQGEHMAHAYVQDGTASGNQQMPAFDQASESLQRALRPMVEAEMAHMRVSMADTRATTDHIRLVASALWGLMTLSMALVAWMTARSITRPVRAATAVAERIASGDLSAARVSGGRDDVGRMLHAIGVMQDKLKELIAHVQRGAHALSDSAQEIATANQDLSRRTEHNAAALQQTSASMNQVDQATERSAQCATQVHREARQASQVADQTRHAVADLEQTIRKVEQTARRIGEISGAIDGIAFQTNILALNAAVESARAGDAGRGFAVVAAEVRTLAQRAASAAREIKTLNADTVDSVAHSTTLALKVQQAMVSTFEAIAQVSERSHTIDQLSGEQRRDLHQIHLAVTKLDESTQQNAAMVEQTAAAAESLRTHARQLNDAVAAFRIEGAPQPVDTH